MRSSKKISFNERVSVHPVPERSTNMTPGEKSQVYYSKEELTNFQLERKQICNKVIQQARFLSKINPAVSPAKNVSLILKSNANLRGFEALLCPTRKRNKTMALEAVHDYQNQLNAMKFSFTPQQKEVALAELYSKVTYWSQMLALFTARNDRSQLYELDMVRDSPQPIEVKSESIPSIVSPIQEIKRKCSVIEEQHQRKRVRL
ncbi:hypothetical protein HJC23_005442 [Cyclotella cryptica]|uniref:Uncharacterized protein n=1 Tax=Cyclotella cryptica TaxID=29204 RepID=A0ABD3P2B6_9STRA|eukprot:CCRYP_017911-RA/>CCRYP_017911-RA protein AED:0.03 eAED:0.03 QI:496/1/1/1/0/0/2/337/203